MGPEITVLVSSAVGVVVSGYLLIDAILDRLAVKRLDGDAEEGLEAFTRNRGIAETLRFLVLIAWLYAAIVAIAGRGVIRETIIWTLALIPVLITAASIHSWWVKKRVGIKPPRK